MTDEAPYENELRVLLERTVPQLPAPPDRLTSVRKRMVRRRARRAAGGAALAAAAAAVTVTLLPTEHTAVLPAAPVTQAPSSSYTEMYFPRIEGLSLALPNGWHTGVSGGTTVAASQPLPVRTLESGGGLLSLTLENSKTLNSKVTTPPSLSASLTVSRQCRIQGGTTSYSGLIGSPSAAKTVIVELCVAGPAPRLVADVRSAVAEALFPGPTSAPTPKRAAP
ncbi:hypothetical protein [Streptomyces sp. NBC_01465]|uniref:hypothetical protein n=1 Tax=Streptomyces sp. NBC_01465 TaxID=2903878 RepID=UPI002E36DDBA|nr:hypothetical protein [Streptomyces sp. NBC_01465]